MDSGQSREPEQSERHSGGSSHNFSLSVLLLTRSLFLVTCQNSGKNQIVREACNMMTIVVSRLLSTLSILHFHPYLEDRYLNIKQYMENIEADWRLCRQPRCWENSTGWTKKKWDLKNNGHNSSEIHQKGKKLQDRHQTFQNWWKNGLEK